MAEGICPPGKDAGVIVVGGGPVGLATAIELARLGVATTLVEAGDGSIRSPKMNLVNVRTMEFCRRWGLTDAVREAGHPPEFHPNAIWVTSVTGYEIDRIEMPPFLEQASRFYSPAADCLCSQLWFDPILLAHARTLPALTLMHLTELTGFSETEDGIEARVRDCASGAERTISAAYLVGCDGAQSPIREALGITMSGLERIQRNFHIFFNSEELLQLLGERFGYVRFCSLIAPGRTGTVITSINWRGFWRYSVSPPPEDESRVPDLLREAVGRDFKFELLNSSHWTSRELVADQYGKGRVFIAGDAAHQNTTAGGFGMNTGVGDSMDLAWKLWALVAGWGGPALIDSYQAERQPVARRNAQEATRNLLSRKKIPTGAAIETDTPEGEQQRAAYRAALKEASAARQHNTDGICLGYRYEASPIICPDGSEASLDEVTDYVQTARPGHRAPHAWLGGPPLADGVRPAGGRSMLDLFGDGFVLLQFDRSAATKAFEEAAAGFGMPLKVETLDEPEIAALYEQPLVLVRPDGHVAWRGASDTDADRIIATVTGHADIAASRTAPASVGAAG